MTAALTDHELLTAAQNELAKLMDAYAYHRQVNRPAWFDHVLRAQLELSLAISKEEAL